MGAARRRFWLLGLALVVQLLTAGGKAWATEPVVISYHRAAGTPIVCNSDMTPAFYDVGVPKEGETDMPLPFLVGNLSRFPVTDVEISLTGSQVPDVFRIYYTNNTGYIYPNSGAGVTLRFRPPEGDPSGTVYGGDASKVLLRVTYNYKPDKGKKRAGIPLELVLAAHKR